MPSVSPSTDTASVTTSGAEIIKSALQDLGAVDPDETLSATNLATGLLALNWLLDSRNLDETAIWNYRDDSVSTALREPTVGPGGILDIIRPPSLKQGQVFIRNGETDYELTEMTRERWANYGGLTTTGIPSGYWYEPESPLGILHFDITPDQAYTLRVYSWQLLNQISDASASLRLPPGYPRALAFDLAIDLAPKFPGQRDVNLLLANANAAWGAVKRVNVANRPAVMQCDEALMGDDDNFDILTNRSRLR